MRKELGRFTALVLTLLMCAFLPQGTVLAEDAVLIEDSSDTLEEMFQTEGANVSGTAEDPGNSDDASGPLIEEESPGKEKNEETEAIPVEEISAETAGETEQETAADMIAGDADGIIEENIDSEQVQELMGTYEMLQPVSEVYINPLYSDVVSEEELTVTDEYAVLALAEDPEYVTPAEAVTELRSQMKQRRSSIKLYVVTQDSGYVRFLNEIPYEALKHTGNPVEGDYLKWQYGGWNGQLSGYKTNGVYYLCLDYSLTYYTTAAQEAQMDSAIAALKKSLDLENGNKTGYEKIKNIYDYICQNVTYDYANLNNSAYKLKYTAYAALINETAVCQGYAVLFYRLALECGIDARVISGTGNGADHGWNIVKSEGRYYNLDATWDASGYGKNGRYLYFLKSDDGFEDHVRDAEYASDEFYASYPMALLDYGAPHTHSYNEWITVIPATCIKQGLQERCCIFCGEKDTRTITGDHTWNAWKTVSAATVFAAEKQTRTCANVLCSASQARTVGTPLKKTISVTASSLTMQVKQKTKLFKVTFANGDSVVSWKSSDKKVVKVAGKANGTCTITAQKKKGKATITITLKSGLTKKIKVKVQNGTVSTSSVSFSSKKITLIKGQKLTLKPIISPITSQDKVTYSTSNKKIATVTSKGVVKGVKAGTAKITVRSGKKKAVCTIVVKNSK